MAVYLPDLNPIESLLDYLERKLERLPTATLSQLWDTLNDLGRIYNKR